MTTKGEGKNLTGSYSWFQDLDVIKNFVLAVGEVVNKLPEEIDILGIGSGVGRLEYAVKKLFEEKYSKKVNLTISDKYTKDIEIKYGADVLKIDNKEMPFPDENFDLVIARSVTHYEKNKSNELKVLNEIRRVLKPEGLFITEAPYLANGKEAKLMHDIHSLVSKPMNLKDYEGLLEIHKEIFDKVTPSQNQPNKPLSVQREDFMKRYEISNEVADSVLNLIKQHNPEEVPNVWYRGNNFGWTVNYSILICSKAPNP